MTVPTLDAHLAQRSAEFEAQNAALKQSNPEKWSYKYSKMLEYERRVYNNTYNAGQDTDYVKINQQEREAEERRAFYQKYPSLQPGVQTDQRTGQAVLVQQGSTPKNNEERLNALRRGAFNYAPQQPVLLRSNADGTTTGVYANTIGGRQQANTSRMPVQSAGQQKLYNSLPPNVQVNESVPTGRVGVLDSDSPGIVPATQVFTKEGAKQAATGFYETGKDTAISLGRGIGKVGYIFGASVAPGVFEGKSLVKIPFRDQAAEEFRSSKVGMFAKENFYVTREEAATDQDLRTVGIGAGIAMAQFTPAGPYVDAGIIGYSGYELAKNPTAPQVGKSAFYSLPAVPGAVRLARSTYVGVTRVEVPLTSVTTAEVAAGKQPFPMASSAQESLAAFKSDRTPTGEYVVTHATDAVLRNDKGVPFTGEFTAGKGGNPTPSGVPRETGGLYVTPASQTSIYFTRVAGGQTYSLVPDVPSLFSAPKIVRSTASGVERVPQPLIAQEGGGSFAVTNAYIESQAGTGKVFITPRSEKGFSGVKPEYPVFGFTKEVEGVYSPGTKFVEVRSNEIGQYVRINGVNVPIQDYAVAGQGTALAGTSSASSGSSLRSSIPTKQSVGRVIYVNSASVVGPRTYTTQSTIPANTSNTPRDSGISGSVVIVPAPQYRPQASTQPKNGDYQPDKYESPKYYQNAPTPQPTTYTPPKNYDAPTNRPPTYPTQTRPTVPTTVKYEPPQRSGKEKEAMFDVLVRRGGKFQRVNATGLSADDAFFKGQEVVRNTAAASFKVVERGGNPASNPYAVDRGIFTTSKRDNNIFVQKNQYRISTPGEKREITFKGVTSVKRKRGGFL